MRNNQPITGIEYHMREDQSLISRTDTKGKITYVNQDFIEMSGFSEDELLGAPHNIVRHPDMPEEAFEDLWRTLKAGESWTGMVKNRRKNGDHYWVLANATPIRENGAVVGYTSVRTAPSRAQIEAAGNAYARFKEGRAGGWRIKKGKAVRTGIIGEIAGLMDLHVKGKLIAVVSLLCVILMTVGTIGLSGMSASNQGLRTVYDDRVVPLSQLDLIVRLLSQNRLDVAEAVIAQNPSSVNAAVTDIENNIETIGKTWNAYMATYLTPEEKKLAEQFAIDRASFVDQALKPALSALKDGKFDEARRLETEVMVVKFETVKSGINALIKLQIDVAAQETEKAQAHYQQTRNIVVAMISAALLFAIFLARYLLRSIVQPLNRAVDVAKQIAAGNLTAEIAANSGDETGQMLHALNVMNKSLSNIISGVRNNAEAVSAAAGQIAVGNTDLSQRTEEQASTLQETASSMEELTSTVKHNADNSQQATKIVHAARDIAVQGGEAMGEVVNTMNSIADSSKKITDIISVIDGIAFQTNILALNAAVEAARAGEQGRGFAVVASEVRSLAQRSAAAAKEIKDLIGDSVSKVESGSKQVSDARHTMDQIVEAVKKATEIMNDISNASAEQSNGIFQVSQAVMQMDEVTQQNSALVEEAAAAAESLQSQGAALVQGVGVFKLKFDQFASANTASMQPAKVRANSGVRLLK
ncbi:MAG: MCP four helix bundle domain-containing protein [Burkholderiales bacterium]|nr:MCP four helix bundle domain-containing protein [Burkholderiales bacterium]